MSVDRWRLEDIYPDRSDWEADLAELAKLPERISAFRGRLAEGPGVLVECLDSYYDGLRRLYRASSYASMR